MSAFKLGGKCAAFCGLLLLITGGCANQSRPISIAPSALPKFESSTIRIIQTQQELVVQIDPSMTTTAMGGGALWALVDMAVESSRTKKAESLIIPIRNALIDFPVMESFKSGVESELGRIEWLGVPTVELRTGIKGATPSNPSAAGLVLLETEYYLTPDFSALVFASKVSVFAPRGGSANSKPGPIYRKDFESHQSLPNKSSKELAARAWGENNGERIKAALTVAMTGVTKDIQRGLSSPQY